MRKIICSLFFGSFFLLTSFGWSQDIPIQIDFSGNTLEENQLSAQGAGFGAFPQGDVTFGSIPTDNTFEGATDGQGAIVTCDPGEGVMLIAPNVQSTGALLARCSIRANAPHGAIVIATVDQSSNTFVSTNSPNNGAYFFNQYRKLGVLSIPSPNPILPIIQVFNPSETEPLVVYLDNLEFFPLDLERCYNAEFFATDESDPEFISEEINEQPEPTPTPSPTPTNTPTNTPTIPAFPTGFPTIVLPTIVLPTGFPTFPTEPTPTPQAPATPTQQPSGSAIGLRLTVCDEPAVTSENVPIPVTVYVDLVDANGSIVNPGTEGGDAPVNVNVSVSGSAQLSTGLQSGQVTIDDPEGGSISVSNQLAETVTVTATAAGLNDAEPVSVEFVPSGTITGTMRVWDGQSFVLPPFGFNSNVEVLHTTAAEYSSPEISIDLTGEYTISGLLPGTYTLRFTPLESTSFPGLPSLPTLQATANLNDANQIAPSQFLPQESSNLEWVCQSNLTVTANQELSDVNIDFGPRQQGSTVSGTITRADGETVTNANVLLIPDNYVPVEGAPNTTIDCNTKSFTTSVLNLFQDPNFVASFEFSGVPNGTYRLYVIEYPIDEEMGNTLLTNGTGQTVIVNSGNVQQDVVIDQSAFITPLAPINYSREGSAPVFQFEKSAELSNQSLTISLYDRCNNEIWVQEGITGTEIQYTGPALSNEKLYFWFIRPTDLNQFFFNSVFSTELNIPSFVVQ